MADPIHARALALLRRGTGWPDVRFRNQQYESIEAIAVRRARLLVVQRTGWGKSMVYFIATRLLRDRGSGPTLLISPLLALMRNQVEAAVRIGLRTGRIDSSNQDEWADIEQAVRDDILDLLLVSPERLTNPRFVERVLQPVSTRIGLLVVDEAHCISDWGHDFRPDYQRIVRLLRNLPGTIPVLATTATANDRVVEDVARQIGRVETVRGPLVRSSLRLQVIRMHDPARRLAWLADVLPDLPGSGIIYTLTKASAHRVTDWLRARALEVVAYTGAMDREREHIEQALLGNKVKAVAATSALGMGFDKPDLGFVIHFQRPPSPVHYYQQVGRAGRNVERAYGILLEGGEDDEIAEWMATSNELDAEHVRQILHALEQAEEPLTPARIEASVNLSRGKLLHALRLLHAHPTPPVDRDGMRWTRTIHPYQPDLEQLQRLRRLRERERERMARYVDGERCLMEYLQRELNDPSARACGHCSVCVGSPLVPVNCSQETLAEAQRFLRRQYVVIEPRKRWDVNALATMKLEKTTIPSEWQVEPGRALCRWGDPGYGGLVRAGKQRELRFDQRLVRAVATMVRVWEPDPFPQLVTSVPSLRTGALVPDFAARLARDLEIPYLDTLAKVRETRPQKLMENSYQQMRNLDGAFAVRERHPLARRVFLLVDDLVDSRWTFTLAGALLRRAGAAAVYPVALASTAPDR